MRQRHIVTLLSLLASPAFHASAIEPDNASTFRATRAQLPDALVNYVATHAEPRLLDRATYPAAHQVSAQGVIELLCGKNLPEYEAVWRQRNGLPNTFDMRKPMGDKAYTLNWPACFYIRDTNSEFVVQPNRTLSGKFVERIGRAGSAREMQAYFQRANIDDVQPGETVPLPFATESVTFTPSVDRADFERNLTALSVKLEGDSRTAAQKVTVKPKLADEIVTAVSDAGVALPDCVGSQATPFDAARVRQRLSVLHHAYKKSLSNVTVMVLDNGFSAAHLTGAELTFASKFPKPLFQLSDNNGEEELETPVAISDEVRLQPLIRLAEVNAPRAIAGHGTHVTGTVIGGQWMDPVSTLFVSGDQESWLRLRVIPLSAGTQRVSRIALDEAMFRVDLSQPKIVNMSVRYGSGQDEKLRKVIVDNRKTLFVVAAGNDSRDVSSRYGNDPSLIPASLGGDRNDNVISVGAENGYGYLTPFSNYSASRVDIAALGCNVASTLDGEQVDLLSGTSQAAALVSFAATLLARHGLDAKGIKRRLLISGDLLEGVLRLDNGKPRAVAANDQSPAQVYSRSRVNIEKAMLFNRDYLRLRVKGAANSDAPPRDVELTGDLHVQGAIDCGVATDGQHIFALKRSASGGLWCFRHDQLAPSMASPGDDFQVFVEVRDELNVPAGGFSRYTPGQTVEVALGDLQEFIRSENYLRATQEEQ
ncbi:S8 family serine peptidase [Pseudomonas sp. SDO524_S393]